MKILDKGVMPNGTHIQIEDWNENYSFLNYADTLAAYTKSKSTHIGTYAPKAGETYRFSFRFKSTEDALNAYICLLEGKTELSDYKHLMAGKLEYRDCI
ncbi:hypothetical protein NBRC13296_12265 [Paenibacillus chitinolyticus]|uniref:hypothetical protein n=1 Tax=Paenibacillus chitinolyticus TaxID=79263 RepID=UPI003556A7A2